MRSIPGMGHVISLLDIIFYSDAVAGYHLLHCVDAERCCSLGDALHRLEGKLARLPSPPGATPR